MLPTIESSQNPKIKRVVRLRDASARRKSQRFLIDGWPEIAHAVEHGIQLESLFFADAAAASIDLSGTPPGCDMPQRVSPKVMAHIAYGQRADCPVAVAVTPPRPLSALHFDSHSLILILDRTEKPGNLGACLRTASACGADAVILTEPICELYNPNAIRASRGAVFTVPIAIAGRSECQQLCQQRGIPVFAGRIDGAAELWDLDLRLAAALVFGNEAQGLGPEWNCPDSQGFQIPMREVTDSLNLSISVAVTLYEAFRQRRH